MEESKGSTVVLKKYFSFLSLHFTSQLFLKKKHFIITVKNITAINNLDGDKGHRKTTIHLSK